jgi:glutamate-ammonia-ligase adenylyltransferase
MVDAEFVVQHLVLAHAGAYPQLQDNVGNIALLNRCEQAGLLPQGVGSQAANAYRDLRRAQHHARLDEKPTQFPLDQWSEQAQAINALWRAVLS